MVYICAMPVASRNPPSPSGTFSVVVSLTWTLPDLILYFNSVT